MTQITITRVGIQGAQGEQGRVGIPFTYSTTTTQGDPGAGALRLNNAALASVTAAVLDATSAASGNPDVSDAIAAYGAGTSAIKARLRIAKASAPDEVWAEYDITGITDNGTHLSLALTYVDHAGTFTDAMATYLNFSRTGDKGEAGGVDSVNGMTGDVVLSLDADGIGFDPAGNLAATDVQAALEELDSEKTTEGYVSTNYLAKLGAGNTTDNAIPRWDGTAGGALQNSGVIIDDSNNLTGIAQLTAAALVAATLALSGQSLTGAQATPLLDLATTWNTTGTPTALKVNVTDTASNAASLLADFQVGGASQFSVGKTGNVTMAGPYFRFNQSSGLTFTHGVSDIAALRASGGDLSYFHVNGHIGIGYPSVAATRLYADADHILAQRNGTNAQALRIYNSYTDGSNYERAGLYWSGNVFYVGTQNAGTGTARALQIGNADAPTTIYGQDASSAISLTNGTSYVSAVGVLQLKASFGTHILSVSSSGLTFATDNTYDIGASGATRPRSGYFGTSLTVPIGIYTGQSLTGSQATSLLDMATTWNTTGTPTAIKLNVTATASNASSMLMDLQVGGVKKFAVRKDGGIQFEAGLFDASGDYFTQLGAVGLQNGGNWASGVNGALGSNGARFSLSADSDIGWTGTSSNPVLAADVRLWRDAAAVLALRNGTNAQTFRWYYSFTDLSNRQNGALKTAADYVELAAETAGTGADNIDVLLSPAGTGNVRFGTHSAIAAETVTGYITIKDAGGTTRKLAVVS